MGDRIAKNVASHGGRADIVLLENLTGDEIGVGIAEDKDGFVSLALLRKIKGDGAGGFIGGDKGRFQVCSLQEIKGKNTGELIASCRGRGILVSFYDSVGENFGEGIAFENGLIHKIDSLGQYKDAINQLLNDYRSDKNMNIEEEIDKRFVFYYL